MTSIIIIAVVGLATLFTGVYRAAKATLPLAVSGLIAAFVFLLVGWGEGKPLFNDMIWFDNYAIAFSALIIVLGIIVLVLSHQYYSLDNEHLADIYALFLFTIVGGIQMAAFYNITILFIGLETLSIALYILAGSKKLDKGSNEASLKYFLMGSFATGFLLLGIAFIYGSSGTLEVPGIRDYVIANGANLPLMMKAGIFLVIVGLGFKVSAAPFHFWAPDVYQGSPTIISAFMASAVKTAAFAGLFRLMYICFGSIVPVWYESLWMLAALTIAVGNLTAIFQVSVKRMLAYSSIANAGYMLVGILAMNEKAAGILFYYTAAYSLATICAFAIVMRLQKVTGSDDYSSFHGLAKRNPLMTGVMIISMLSLAGIPPLSGFFAKYFIFANAIESDYIWIIVIAVLGSVIGVYYYFKAIVAMFKPAEDESKIENKTSFNVTLVIAALIIILMGIAPAFFTGLF